MGSEFQELLCRAEHAMSSVMQVRTPSDTDIGGASLELAFSQIDLNLALIEIAAAAGIIQDDEILSSKRLQEVFDKLRRYSQSKPIGLGTLRMALSRRLRRHPARNSPGRISPGGFAQLVGLLGSISDSCVHADTGISYEIKIIDTERVSNLDLTQRFLREIRRFAPSITHT